VVLIVIGFVGEAVPVISRIVIRDPGVFRDERYTM
jgi:hypothetical protein